MISFVRGTIRLKQPRFVVIDVGGVGYQVFCAASVLSGLGKTGEAAELFTKLFVREDALELYGFEEVKGLELFEFLLTVSGIGPRAALGIMGVGQAEDVVRAIEEGNEKFFAGIPGVGSKKVKKVILELSGKLPTKEDAKIEQKLFIDAKRALVSLGFSVQDVREALREVPQDISDSKDIVRQALKLLGKQGS